MTAIENKENIGIYFYAPLWFEFYGPDEMPPIVLKNCTSVPTPFLVNFFVSAHIQSVTKNGDRYNHLN